ncbi:MAG: ribokinase [Thermoleophilaceae bacterium]|jgi:ribokinase|nr:ribokinase [Thermoleophilaceae bacterium]
MTPATDMRIAVLGHVEHVEFAAVDRVPAAGQIAHAFPQVSVAAGGGAVAAVQIARLAGACDFFTALGDDDLGSRCAVELEELGVTVHAAFRGTQRRALTLIDPTGERTITTIGEKLVPARSDPLPWELLEGVDAVFFVAGDAAALAAARGARVLAAAARGLPEVAIGGTQLDAVIGSARDPGEALAAEGIEPPPGLVLATAGAAGGEYRSASGQAGSWAASPVPGPVADTYGCGDSFAAAFTFGLARGDSVVEAVDLAARCGAACASGHGPYPGQLAL